MHLHALGLTLLFSFACVMLVSFRPCGTNRHEPTNITNQGPVLVTQGVKDPLNDAEGRATLFQALGPQVSVVRLDGGHW